MAATSIRVDEATKRDLDDLQAEVQLRQGKRLSHAELLARLLTFVRAREREFFGGASWRPFTEEEWQAFAKGGAHTGVTASAAEIDEVLYGGDRP